MRLALGVVLVVALAGCIELDPPGGPPAAARRVFAASQFPPLDPGAKFTAGLHFEVHAYGSERAEAVARLAERLYERIMTDTGLYSFIPGGLYPIVIYGTREEFLRKTGLPSWSAGAAVGNAIVSYDGPHLAGVLTHEMTHLIWYEYMGRADASERWLNEGLAVYEEQEADPTGAPPRFAGAPIPFDRMVDLAPLTEESRLVDAWYQQAGSVVRFLVERGGRVGFGQFLQALRERRPLDEALRLGFPGAWRDAAALEAAWRQAR